MPFTSRKLINRIDRLMPIPHKDLMTLGDIQFAPDARIVKAHGREKRLTPKAANLLLIFMKHPEKILGRGLLMQEVWHTDYIGDTRTLDVHIRWLREALEPKPSRPQHIETVRGRGYCFFPSLEDKRERKKSQK
jgi:DNA-binding response OmpR family regulator